MTARASSRLSALSSLTMLGSSPTRVSAPGSSSMAATSRSERSGLVVATMSRTSRANRESLPIRATVGSLGNLDLRGWVRGFQTAAQDAADTDRDAAGHVSCRQREQQKLRPVRHPVNEPGDQDDDERRIGFTETDPLEAVVAPGAHHEETEQRQQQQPGHGERPPA